MGPFSFFILIINVLTVFSILYLIFLIVQEDKFNFYWFIFCIMLALSILLQMERVAYLYRTERLEKSFYVLSLFGFLFHTIKYIKNKNTGQLNK